MKPSQQIADEMADNALKKYWNHMEEGDIKLKDSILETIPLQELVEVAIAAQREVNAYKSCMSPIPTSIQHLEQAIENLTKKGFSFE